MRHQCQRNIAGNSEKHYSRMEATNTAAPDWISTDGPW